ncbi:RNA polymerase sigma-70 factor [Pedobacter chinensis]|uniref:RNA polymerase sigma-70 factor n=1 Tax=Pedobacter chinensis TaxID=2282421 RepID=A0A369Q098_9SPHI|nr:RNA polymerase sigma-70 factor [Pedobacter chinensis]RDC56657.1 RNA polymerase sigma-70 factor [Pedobacter chinensis]
MRDYSGHSDHELIDLIKVGDEYAFENLYNRYWDRLLYFANQKTGDRVDAENIVQDVFVSLWNRRSELQITSEIAHYLVVSIKYRVIRLFEKQRTQRLNEEKSLSSFDILDNSTQQYLEFDELKQRLEKLICELPEKSAIIFRLSREDGLSHKEIAGQLDISERAVNDSLVKTKKSLSVSLRSFLNSYLL